MTLNLVGNRSREDSHLGHKCVIQCNRFLQDWLFSQVTIIRFAKFIFKVKYKHKNQLSTNPKFWSKTIYVLLLWQHTCMPIPQDINITFLHHNFEISTGLLSCNSVERNVESQNFDIPGYPCTSVLQKELRQSQLYS